MRVVVAMSGGVDSSVAALRLRDAGHDVVGVFLRNGVTAHAGPSKIRGCCSVRDACDAEEVAALLGVPFHSVDHSAGFQSIIDGFVAEYEAGRTPNPCVRCNRELKFGELFAFADALGADAVATGHYARLHLGPGTAEHPAEVHLHRAVDGRKDQSYVLGMVDARDLRRALFPLGDLPKDEVRALAAAAGLPVSDKEESQEICFVPSGDHRDLLRAKRPDAFQPGPIQTRDGVALGTHDGAMGYTVGQRRGLGLSGGPWFVTATDPQTNVVTVARQDDVGERRARLVDVNWVMTPPEGAGERVVAVQLRAHHPGTPAVVRWEGASPATVDVWFDEPAVVSPGQVGALFDGDRVLAAGWVRRDDREFKLDDLTDR